MFSANENLMLRQHKRRIVEQVESTIPEDALDMGTTVMVMQVSCKAPGCVPLETAIIVVFPKAGEELIPGLPESGNGGSYKTKILKPMSDVTKDDVLEALPPAFEGGKRTMEKLCNYARDVMLAQITQLFGEDGDESSVKDRKEMAEYLQGCLQDYIARNCKPPELGEPFPPLENNPKEDDNAAKESTVSSPNNANPLTENSTASATSTETKKFPAKGNIVIRRVVGEHQKLSATSATTSSGSSTSKPAVVVSQA